MSTPGTSTLQITLPSSGAQERSQVRAQTTSASPTPIPSSTDAPSSLSGFTCYGVNVSAPDISYNGMFSCSDPANTPSILAGFVPAAGANGTISVTVPTGSARTIEVFGVISTVGCPDIQTLLAQPAATRFANISEPILLASTTTDVFADSTVTLTTSYNPSSPSYLFHNCNSLGGSSAIPGGTLLYSLANGTPNTNPSPSPSVAPSPLPEPIAVSNLSGQIKLFAFNSATNIINGYSGSVQSVSGATFGALPSSIPSPSPSPIVGMGLNPTTSQIYIADGRTYSPNYVEYFAPGSGSTIFNPFTGYTNTYTNVQTQIALTSDLAGNIYALTSTSGYYFLNVITTSTGTPVRAYTVPVPSSAITTCATPCTSIAVHAATQDLYVLSGTSITSFSMSLSGTPTLTQLATFQTTSGGGLLVAPMGIAVGPANEAVYVANNNSGGSVAVFSAQTGAFLTEWPVTNNGVAGQAAGIALDAMGVIYVTDSHNQFIDIYASFAGQAP
ncbi:MAG: hypothetical protein P4M08_03685 [Oligoflexia bacterium]|nr:hypothetical protein [Oligoflexia bacterium]